MKFRLQYLRAVAAFLVVIWHASYHLWDVRGDSVMLAKTPGLSGAFGVTLFFVISGYLMATLAVKATPGQFMIHRVIRIYPIYWIVLAAVFAINVALGVGFSIDPLALALMPGQGRNYTLGVEWTLPFELSFYFIVFVVMLVRATRFIPLIATVWAVVILALLQLMPILQQGQFPRLSHLLVSEWTLPFALGLLVPAAIKRGFTASGLSMALGLVLVAFALYAQRYSNYILPFACWFLVHWSVVPRGKDDARNEIRWLTKLGDWSYALYLCHVPIMMWFFQRAPKSWSNVALYVLVVVLSLGAAIVMGSIDLAMYRRLKQWVDARRPAPTAAMGASFALLLLCYGCVSEVQAWRSDGITQQADALGHRLEQANPQTQAQFDAASAHMNLSADTALHGYVDNVRCDPDGSVQVTGWAADSTTGSAGVAVLVFGDGRYFGSTVPNGKRDDVTKALELHALFQTPGFSAMFRKGACDGQCPRFTSMVVKGSSYALLPSNEVVGATCLPH